MGIFKQALRDIIKWANSDSEGSLAPQSSLRKKSLSSGSDIQDNNRGFNFTVFNATGGKVIQIHSYDPKLDRTTCALYIITDKEDFGEELSHIITRDSLSR